MRKIRQNAKYAAIAYSRETDMPNRLSGRVSGWSRCDAVVFAGRWETALAATVTSCYSWSSPSAARAPLPWLLHRRSTAPWRTPEELSRRTAVPAESRHDVARVAPASTSLRRRRRSRYLDRWADRVPQTNSASPGAARTFVSPTCHRQLSAVLQPTQKNYANLQRVGITDKAYVTQQVKTPPPPRFYSTRIGERSRVLLCEHVCLPLPLRPIWNNWFELHLTKFSVHFGPWLGPSFAA